MFPRSLDREIRRLLESRWEQPLIARCFTRGGRVRIVAGPFTGFSGIVEGICVYREKVKVNVFLFGRVTPVEVDTHAVETVRETE